MSLAHVSLRQAGAADWPAIAALLQAHQLPLDGAQAHLHTFLLAVKGVEVIGVAGAEVHGDVALLRSVAVAPGLQSQGVGALLVGTLIDQARRRGIQRLYLLTTTAAAYFERHGFSAIPRADAPGALQASAEFQGACPASAVLMAATLAEPSARAAETLPVAVIGAGPVGLAAAARLVQRGLEPLILEAGDSVGASLLDYGHVRLFSPWRYNVDAAMAALLAPTGWQAPPDEVLPLAGEVVERVLRPFAALPAIAPRLHLRTRITAISREGFDKVKTAGREQAPFVIHALRDGEPVTFRARAVIDASGTWGTPNPLGANGLPAAGEREHAARIAYGIPDVLGRDRERYAGRRTLVVGAGHSAANALLGLAELARSAPGTRLAWAVRTPVLQRVFGGGAADALPARGQLGSDLKALRDSGALEFVSGLRITALRREGDTLTVEGIDPQGRPVSVAGIDQIICATGQRPDLSLAAELRLKLDPWLESSEALGPLIDPNLHSCGTVRPHGHRELSHPEPGFYTIGVKSYGRAPTFLMATGFEQARSVVAALAGDTEAADRVELDLPETGVCSIGGSATEGVGDAACCGSAEAPAAVNAAAGTPAVAAAGCGGGGSCGVPAKARPAQTPAPAPAPAPAQASAKAAVPAASGCCGGPAQADASACCALDEQKKAEGEAGCGCGSTQAAAAPAPVAAVTAAAARPAQRSACCS
jgi:N-acetylglutamate synthase-like GNAT family acetyltransferase